MTHTIKIIKLACGKYQVRTDCGLNEGHFEDFAAAHRQANKIALNVRRAGHKSEIVHVAA